MLELAQEAARDYGRVGLELSLGTQAADRMVGEPTTFTRDWFTGFGDIEDATPLLAGARAVKTEQEIERMRLANEIAAAAMEHCKLIIEPGMSEAQIAAEWEGFVHGEGTGWEGKVDLALGFSLVWSGAGIKTFTATTSRPVVEGEPTLFEIWVCADGYWCDHTKNLVVGELTPAYRDLEAGLMAVYEDAIEFARPGASLAELDRRIRAGIDAMGFPGQPSHPVCHGVGARAHEPPYAHQAGRGEIAAGMVLAIEPGCYIEGAAEAPCRGQLPDHGTRSREALAVPGWDRPGVSRGSAATASAKRTPSGILARPKLARAGFRSCAYSAGRARAGSCRRRSAEPDRAARSSRSWCIRSSRE